MDRKAQDRLLRAQRFMEVAEQEFRERHKPPPPAREVGLRELDRRASAVISEVIDDGAVLAITKHGLPVALVLPVTEAIRLLPASYVTSGDLGELSRRFAKRTDARRHSRAIRGRGRDL